MQNKYILFYTLMLFVLSSVNAQQYIQKLQIHKDDKVIIHNVSEIDSISFKKSQLYRVTVTSSDTQKGSVMSSSNLVEGDSIVTITAIPEDENYFLNWTVGDKVVSTNNPYSDTIVSDIEYVANFTNYKSSGTHNGYEYVDLGLSVKWATFNVGANSIEDYGDHYAWGETEPKDDYTIETYTYKLKPDVLPLSDDAANVNWGGNWRMPTTLESEEIANPENTIWIWTQFKGVEGYRITSKINGNSIFIPASGVRTGTSLDKDNTYIWLNNIVLQDKNFAYAFGFSSTSISVNIHTFRYFGFSIRAVCE